MGAGAVRFLVAAGVVLRGHENQPRAGIGSSLLRCAAKGMQDADDYGISGDDANSDGHYDGEAENQRHEERNQGQPPYLEFKKFSKNRRIQIHKPALISKLNAASSIYLR
jgi:hypothetical protein